MAQESVKKAIMDGQTALGIELGSTRIKAVLIGPDNMPVASGSHSWENRLENGVWTYHLDDVWSGIQDCYKKLTDEVRGKYDVQIETIGSIGFSAMMHGYLVFDKAGNQLVPFRTWRNTTTEQAAEELTKLFSFNIPQRWSIAHLYQAILNDEPHVSDISFLTTLAGYVHFKLTGQKVLGVGEASGVFPIDSAVNDYNAAMVKQFDDLLSSRGIGWRFDDILPKVLNAGEAAGTLTAEGAKLLDPSGALRSDIPLCPPEGDAGTGMVATNSVAARTGNVSAGTSIFAMVVLEKDLSKVYPEIDMVTTPTGKPVAMVHCNNCTSDIDAWIRLFGQVLTALSASYGQTELYNTVFSQALNGKADAGGLLSCNYFAGEPITGFDVGRPFFARLPDSEFTLANFSRALLYSAMATLRIGLDILTRQEGVKVDIMRGHGGLFKTPGVGQTLMAGALNTPVSVMQSAGEGGAWGIALLAGFMRQKEKGERMEEYLANKVFLNAAGETVKPDKSDVEGFERYLRRYKDGLAIERAAVEQLKQ